MALTLCLCGDVMTGRGIDQILPRPCDPVLYEDWMKSAEEYVGLAERASGPIPRGVEPSYPWGDALAEVARIRPDAWIVNLETALTRSEDAWPDKGINYRTSPENAETLAAAGVDCCALANNHVLDWGYAGLDETLRTLAALGIRYAGAGRNLAEAEAPAVLELPGPGRLLVYSFACASSGVPASWAASATRPGVALLPDLSPATLERIASLTRAERGPGDVAVASLHWGANWGFAVGAREREFARALVERAGFAVVHGHSSHHVKGIEVHRGRPILYGCGDFLDDYEGIGGYEEFRGDLGGLYVVTLAPPEGGLERLRVVPTRVSRFQVSRACGADVDWLAATLDREGARFRTSVERTPGGELELRWEAAPGHAAPA